MMGEPKPSRKWSCDYCTYENWPASKKCTLCRAPKPPQLITEEGFGAETDIYKMASLVSPEAAAPSSPVVSPTMPTSASSGVCSKWACQACTYLNWPKATKCSQCLTPRPKVAVVASLPPAAQDHTQPLSISVNIAESSGSGSRKSSPNSPEAAKALNNDKNRAVAAKSGAKWTCKACTYENWPKSQKCVLCGVTRGRTYSDTDSGKISPDSDTNKQRSSKRASPPTVLRSSDNTDTQQAGGATASPSTNTDKNNQDRSKNDERRLRRIRNRMRDVDWLWLNACQGVVEGDTHYVEAFLASGGDAARQLSADECTLLNRPSAFQLGFTLVHLAIRFQREDILAALLTATEAAAKGKKRMPSHVSPDVAADILREVSASLRQRKGDFPCYFLTDVATFALPADIADLPRPVQKELFDEILDRDVQKELEVEEPIINWSPEITERLGSRLYALWNRTAGDCLLDSVLQSTWGVFDKDNTLRRALGDSLNEGASMYYPRWKETETSQAQALHFSLDESQCQQDWGILLSLASQPGASLEQIHIFAVAHILRRPIIVYGIKFVKSFRGENIGLARFQGVYLPLLWEQSFCWKSPISLAYTRGHFSALVSLEIDQEENIGAGANIEGQEDSQIAYLPLMDSEGKLLPVHFLSGSEVGRQEAILREWLDCCVTSGGLLVAQQKVTKRPVKVRQMVDEWLDRYRQLARMVQTSRNPCPPNNEGLSSDGETDDE